MCIVIPFPRVRNREFVWRIARRMAELRPHSAEKHLAYQIHIQAQTMARRGIAPDLIEQECAALETAVRVELAHFDIGGAA